MSRHRGECGIRDGHFLSPRLFAWRLRRGVFVFWEHAALFRVCGKGARLGNQPFIMGLARGVNCASGPPFTALGVSTLASSRPSRSQLPDRKGPRSPGWAGQSLPRQRRKSRPQRLSRRKCPRCPPSELRG